MVKLELKRDFLYSLLLTVQLSLGVSLGCRLTYTVYETLINFSFAIKAKLRSICEGFSFLHIFFEIHIIKTAFY